MIPVKGYATFDPLKHCWIGSSFKIDWFSDLSIFKNNNVFWDNICHSNEFGIRLYTWSWLKYNQS